MTLRAPVSRNLSSLSSIFTEFFLLVISFVIFPIHHAYVFVASTLFSDFLSSLQFLEFANNNSHFAALIDSGSQLNLISHTLLPFLKYKPSLSPIRSLRGVTNKSSLVQKWINFDVTLPNGAAQSVTCAVVNDLPCVALFGMPFLRSVRAVHDIYNRILLTHQGPITLVEVSEPSICSNFVAPAIPDIDLSNPMLTEEQRKEIMALILEYNDLWRDERRGKAIEVEHRIRLLTKCPVVSRPRPITDEQKKIIKAEVEKMLAAGVIRPSNSPYASEVVLVMKKTGDWRFCIDFRPLNKVTIPDKYPLPRISDLIRSIKGSRYFAALDLRSGYWQVPMEKESIKYTAFRCFLGLFEFLLMPFGLVNAPATFQRLVDFLFNDLRFAGILCYIDDILVHAPDFNTFMKLLRTVFSRLRATGLTLNLPKSLFLPRMLKYLGQLIEDGQLIPDPQKIAALHQIKPPTNISEVRSLLGFLGYYQAYIPQYATLLSPVFDLLRDHKNSKRNNKLTPVDWTELHQSAVNEAIKRLEHSVLAIPAESNEFMIETDASGHAIGAVLNVKHGEQWKPVEFYSKTLSKTQRNWPAREREAFAIVAALNKFDCYIRCRPFTVHTDHESLKWMLECQKGKIARWASLMAEYNMTIYHKKGSELVHVDFLSRFLDDEPELLLADRMCYFTSTHPIPALSDLISAQKLEPTPTTTGFSEHNGVIYYHGLVYVPAACRTQVIASCHSIAPFHHPGIKKTKATIMKVFNWPGLHQDVVHYLRSCLFCRRCRSGRERLQGLMQSHPIPAAFDTVYMDIWECTYGGQHYNVLTLIDQLTKWSECTIIPKKDATNIAYAFLQSWVYRFGAPRVLMTDNANAFTGEILSRLSARLGITRLTSTPYHPEGHATIESFHNNLSTGLRHFSQQKLPFQEAINLILFGYRATPHSTTGHSPSYLTYGVDPRLAPDCDWRAEPSLPNKERLKFLSTLRLDVQLQAQRALTRSNIRKNESRQPVVFEEGQLVLCRLIPLDTLHYKSAFYKAVPRWTLPHRVLKVMPNQKAAIVRCLLTHKTRQVHIQDVEFVQPPRGETQREEWFKEVQAEAQSMFDPKTCRDVIERFFEELDHPQSTTPTDRAKRRRVTESEGAVRSS